MSFRRTFAALLLPSLLFACTPPAGPCSNPKTKNADFDWVLAPTFFVDEPILIGASATTLYFVAPSTKEDEYDTMLFTAAIAGGEPVNTRLRAVMELARDTDLLVGVRRQVDQGESSPALDFLDIKRIPYDGGAESTLASVQYDGLNGPIPSALLPDGENVIVVTQPYEGDATTRLGLIRVAPNGTTTALSDVTVDGDLSFLVGPPASAVRVGDTIDADETSSDGTQERIRSFAAAGGSSSVLALDAPYVRLLGATASDVLVGTLKPTSNAEVFEGGIFRLADGAAPGTPITLAGQKTITALEPVWARAWQDSRASVFSPDRGSIYYLPSGANDAKVLGCLSDDFTVYALVGHGADVYAVLSTPEEETYGIARFELP